MGVVVRALSLSAALAAAVAVAHGLALWAPFQFDDLHQLADNPAFRDPGAWPRYFSDPYVGSTLGHAPFFRPLLFSFFLLDGMAGGGDPLPYRVSSLLVLAATALAAAWFTQRVLGRGFAQAAPARARIAGALAGLLVAVHPLYNESVLLASSRSSLLVALFGLFALGMLAGARPSWHRQAAVLLATSAALLSKETGVVLAPLALLTTWYCAPAQAPWRRLGAAWPALVPVLLYLVFYLTLYQTLVERADAGEFPESLANQTPPWLYPAQGGLALLGFARLLVLPWGLSPVHELAVPVGLARVLGYAVWVAVPALALWLWRRGPQSRLAAFALAWFALALFPSLALVPLNAPLSEHRAALASVAPLAACGWFLAGLGGERRRAASAALAVALALLAAVQTWPWRTPLTLWQHQTELNPRSARAWGFLARVYFDAGRIDEARAAAQRALAVAPSNPLHLGLAGGIELALGKLDAAGSYYARALAIEDRLAELHLGYAEYLARTGHLAPALNHAETSVRLAPGSSAAWNGLGNVLLMRGQRGEAADAYREALRLDPENHQAARNLEAATRR